MSGDIGTGQAEWMDSQELRSQLERYHRESYGWALSCCAKDPGEAESVLQGSYLKVLVSKAAFNGRATFKTWLFSVIRKTAAQRRRTKILQRFRLVPYEEASALSSPEAAPDETAYRAEIQAMFVRALVRLPRRQREVLQLTFYHDLSLAEVAEVMDISLGSVRRHYERGKKRLRELMEAVKVE